MYAQFLLQLIFYGKNVEEYGDFTWYDVSCKNSNDQRSL